MLADPWTTSEEEVGGGHAELERQDPEDKESCMSHQEFGFYSVPIGSYWKILSGEMSAFEKVCMLGGSLGWPCESRTEEPKQMELGSYCSNPGESKGELERGRQQHGGKQQVRKKNVAYSPE